MAMKHHAVDVVIEVPRGSRNKYEWDEKAKLMRLDRRVPGAVSFPRIMDSFGGHSARTAIPSTRSSCSMNQPFREYALPRVPSECGGPPALLGWSRR